jgi:hypothetical protein
MIRYQQAKRQSAAISSLLTTPPIATYRGRDPLTGQRLVELADGSVDRGNYLSDSEPAVIPQYQPGRSIGVPGYLNNR